MFSSPTARLSGSSSPRCFELSGAGRPAPRLPRQAVPNRHRLAEEVRHPREFLAAVTGQESTSHAAWQSYSLGLGTRIKRPKWVWTCARNLPSFESPYSHGLGFRITHINPCLPVATCKEARPKKNTSHCRNESCGARPSDFSAALSSRREHQTHSSNQHRQSA